MVCRYNPTAYFTEEPKASMALDEHGNWVHIVQYRAQGIEIERLRGELAALQTHFDLKTKLGNEKDAEIERLRQIARKLYREIEGDDQHFETWLRSQT